MTVAELIELLESQNPSSEVRIMSQPNYPFELSVRGVCNRLDIVDDDEVLDESDDVPPCVFIVEGSQICYGSRTAWDAV